jgi:hypothetical protein
LIIVGDRDSLYGWVVTDFTANPFYRGLDRPKALVEIVGGNHMGFTDSIALDQTDNADALSSVLAGPASLARQHAAQRRVSAFFLARFFRKHLALDETISNDLGTSEVSAQVRSLRGVTTSHEP